MQGGSGEALGRGPEARAQERLSTKTAAPPPWLGGGAGFLPVYHSFFCPSQLLYAANHCGNLLTSCLKYVGTVGPDTSYTPSALWPARGSCRAPGLLEGDVLGLEGSKGRTDP